MRRRSNPWRWPAFTALAVVLLLTFTLGMPRSWIDSFLSRHDPGRWSDAKASRPWLVLLPPPVVEVVPLRRAEPAEVPPRNEPVPEVADWWREGWRIRIAETVRGDLRPSAEDSTRYLLTSLGLAPDLAQRARPDSILAARLILLRRQESFRFDELKPYFEAMTRARAYADLHSRAADMYDNFLAQEIMVPD